MDHSKMDHSQMDHSQMDHSQMDHSQMDHSQMDHSQMDHNKMGHSTHMNMGHEMNMDMGMQMFFTAGTHTTILFQGWKTENAGQLFGSMIAIFVLAIIYEVLKYWRETLEITYMTRLKNRMINISPVGGAGTQGDQNCSYSFLSQHHLTQTLMHLVQITIGYFLMLIAMTYNLWCFLAVILGSGAGYFMVGYRRRHLSEFSDHCT